MSHNSRKYLYLLSNLKKQYNEGNKSDLNKENDFYSLMQKKRKRHYSNNNKKNHSIRKCPSCASSFLSKYYKHIHERNNCSHNHRQINLENSLNEQHIKELKYQLSNQNISNQPKNYLYPQNIINNNIDNNINEKNNKTLLCDKMTSSKNENNENIIKVKEDDNSNKIKIIQIVKKISDNNIFSDEKKKVEDLRNNVSDGKNLDKNKNDDDYYANDSVSESVKNQNEKQNIIECRIIKTTEKKMRVKKPKKIKQKILIVEKCIPP